MFTEWMTRGKPTVLGAASGAVAGLVAITPASGYVGPMASVIIGADRGRALLHRRATSSRSSATTTRSTWSACTASAGPGARWPPGSSPSKAVNDAGGDGLFFGNPGQLWTQIVAVAATYVLAIVVTFVILKIVDALVGLRVTDEDEMAGLDLSQHSETAYALGGGVYGETTAAGGAFAEAVRAAEAQGARGALSADGLISRDAFH